MASFNFPRTSTSCLSCSIALRIHESWNRFNFPVSFEVDVTLNDCPRHLASFNLLSPTSSSLQLLIVLFLIFEQTWNYSWVNYNLFLWKDINIIFFLFKNTYFFFLRNINIIFFSFFVRKHTLFFTKIKYDILFLFL